MSKLSGFTQRFRSLKPMRRPVARCSLLLSLIVVALAGPGPPAVEASSPPPEVTGISPNDGPPAGGTTIQITGSNFTGATAVIFWGEHERQEAASFTVNSDTSITTVSPPGYGVQDLIVVGPGGDSATTRNDRFGYGPIVSEMTPRNGPAAGGTSVTLSGFGLEEATGVSFGPRAAASFSVNADGSVTAVSPPVSGDETVVYVTVMTPQGPSRTSYEANRFIYGPTVTGVFDSRGPASGGTFVTIRGTGFSSALYKCYSCEPFVGAVYFGSTFLRCCEFAQFEVESDRKIVAIAPPGAGVEDITVKTVGGTSPITPKDEFTYESSRPKIEEEFAVDVTSSEATLVAIVNPSGSAMTYQFEIANAPNCAPVESPNAPCHYLSLGTVPDGALPASAEAQPVNLKVPSSEVELQPNATYDFRVIATNGVGSTTGSDTKFTTLDAACPGRRIRLLACRSP